MTLVSQDMHPRGTVLHAEGDTPVTIVEPGERRTRVLIGDVDYLLPTTTIRDVIAGMGYQVAGREDDATLEQRLARASEALRVRRTGCQAVAS